MKLTRPRRVSPFLLLLIVHKMPAVAHFSAVHAGMAHRRLRTTKELTEAVAALETRAERIEAELTKLRTLSAAGSEDEVRNARPVGPKDAAEDEFEPTMRKCLARLRSGVGEDLELRLRALIGLADAAPAEAGEGEGAGKDAAVQQRDDWVTACARCLSRGLEDGSLRLRLAASADHFERQLGGAGQPNRKEGPAASTAAELPRAPTYDKPSSSPAEGTLAPQPPLSPSLDSGSVDAEELLDAATLRAKAIAIIQQRIAAQDVTVRAATAEAVRALPADQRAALDELRRFAFGGDDDGSGGGGSTGGLGGGHGGGLGAGLTASERAALETVVICGDTDQMLLAFLRPVHFDMARAADTLRRCCTLRIERRLDALFAPGRRVAADKTWHHRRCWPTGFFGADADGSPVFHDRMGQADVRALGRGDAAVDLEELVTLYMQNMEVRRRWVLTRRSRELGRPVVQMVTVLDLQGMGLAHASPTAIRYTRTIGEIFKTMYADMVKGFYIINTPWVFSRVWGVVEGFLGEETLGKIRILGSGPAALTKLQSYVPAEVIPTFLGGPTEADVGHRDPMWCEIDAVMAVFGDGGDPFVTEEEIDIVTAELRREEQRRQRRRQRQQSSAEGAGAPSATTAMTGAAPEQAMADVAALAVSTRSTEASKAGASAPAVVAKGAASTPPGGGCSEAEAKPKKDLSSSDESSGGDGEGERVVDDKDDEEGSYDDGIYDAPSDDIDSLPGGIESEEDDEDDSAPSVRVRRRLRECPAAARPPTVSELVAKALSGLRLLAATAAAMVRAAVALLTAVAKQAHSLLASAVSEEGEYDEEDEDSEAFVHAMMRHMRVGTLLQRVCGITGRSLWIVQ
ncbi:unnamed protein product [Phaeothamnion confervicola]